MPAKIIQFPALVAAPVVNPKRSRGRYPRNVSSLACARRMRDAKALAAAHAQANPFMECGQRLAATKEQAIAEYLANVEKLVRSFAKGDAEDQP